MRTLTVVSLPATFLAGWCIGGITAIAYAMWLTYPNREKRTE